VQRPLDWCRSTTHLLLRFGLCLRMLTWDWTGPVGKNGGSLVGKSDVEGRQLQGCSPHLCWLRTDGMTPASKDWPRLLQWLWGGEKLRGDSWISQPACWGCSRESLFLRAMDPFNSVGDYTKSCHVQGLPIRSIQVAYEDWRKKHMCHVYQVSLAWWTSIRIVVTLGYE
jgi:hypothetical protein